VEILKTEKQATQLWFALLYSLFILIVSWYKSLSLSAHVAYRQHLIFSSEWIGSVPVADTVIFIIDFDSGLWGTECPKA